jgi:RHS repeat-associated protein
MTTSATCAIDQAPRPRAVTDSYEYDAWGNLLNSTGTTPNVYMYRGEQYDPDLGLYYLRARYYNPLTGRFMSRDPEDGQRINPTSLHKYLYAGGDPVDSIDPSGRASILETGSLDSLIGSAPVPALIEFAGTQAENFLLASGIQDAIAGLQLAADAGSYEEVVDILGYTARAIIKSRPLVRAFLCAPVALAFDFGVDKLNEYAKEHNWNFFQTKAMDTALDVGKDSLKEACGAFVALGGS